MAATRTGLKPWPLKPSERAALRAAIEHVECIQRNGVTPEQVAQAQADLQAMNSAGQPQLALPLSLPR